MNRTDWVGVMPAITTPFRANLAVDHAFLARHAAWMVAEGCTGIVPLGSLGEGGALDPEEKLAVLKTVVKAVGKRVPVIAGIAAVGTAQAVRLAKAAAAAGCQGLMVLPPYVYRGDWREMRAHFAAIIGATKLSCLLYNNPIAYGTDVLPPQVAELAKAHRNLHAIKESSADVRRVTALRALLDDRLALFVGVDDLLVEGIAAGASGWIAGLVNAYPRESVQLFDHARAGRHAEADALYRWFLPLLRMDTVPKFVQLIKLVQQAVGQGTERVRPPRLPLAGPERREALATIAHARAARHR